jgi:hypothetical protein
MKTIITRWVFFGTVLFILSSCGVLVFRDVTCRDFKLTSQNYWFPIKTGDTVVFVNTHNENMVLKVVEKKIEHTTRYYSDTGCSCNDWSGMMLVNPADTIWVNITNDYVFDNKDEPSEDMMLKINHVKSGFYGTQSTLLATYSIGNNQFTNVKQFIGTYTDSTHVKTVYMAKNAGIIRFEMLDGETWTNKSLTQDSIPNLITTFEYVEGSCE